MKKIIFALALAFALVGVAPAAFGTADNDAPICEGTPEVLGDEWQVQQRTREFIPGTAEVSHEVYSYKKKVEQLKTEYRMAKFVRTKSKTYTEPVAEVKAKHYSWTGKKRDADNPPTAVPPHKDWQANTHQEPHGSEATWVNEYLHYTANSKGHASWFYFTPAIPGVPGGWGEWSDFGDWSKWLPEQHVQWQSTPDPIGSPQKHAEWQDGNTKFYREWQVRHDGETRQVPDGYEWVFSGEVTEPLGEPWILLDGYPQTVIDTPEVPDSYTDWTEWADYGDVVRGDEPTAPQDTDTAQYRVEYVGTYVITEATDPKWQDTDPGAPCFNGPEQPEADYFKDQGEYMTCEGLFRWVELFEIPYVWNGAEWVPGEPVSLERLEDKVRDLSPQERLDLGCVTERDPEAPKPTPTPAPEPPPTAEPEPSPEPEDELAETGVSAGWLALLAAGLVVGGAVLVRFSIRRLT